MTLASFQRRPRTLTSSLSYLRDLPIYKVKLDRAFIHEIGANRSNAVIVQGIITMAHHLDLVVVAEGVEQYEEQQDLGFVRKVISAKFAYAIAA